MPLDWQGDEIPSELGEAFYRANEVLGRAFQSEVTANKWQWPNPPSPRDIVDTGNLRQSYSGERTRERGDPAFDHAWNTEYAMAVHEGAVLKNGTKLPARPWTEKPLDTGVLERAFDALAKR